MTETIQKRACDLAVYIIENSATVRAAAREFGAVSYTHLTLPTICSV